MPQDTPATELPRDIKDKYGNVAGVEDPSYHNCLGYACGLHDLQVKGSIFSLMETLSYDCSIVSAAECLEKCTCDNECLMVYVYILMDEETKKDEKKYKEAVDKVKARDTSRLLGKTWANALRDTGDKDPNTGELVTRTIDYHAILCRIKDGKKYYDEHFGRKKDLEVIDPPWKGPTEEDPEGGFSIKEDRILAKACCCKQKKEKPAE